MEEVGDFLQIVSISTVKMNQIEEIGDFMPYSSMKGIKKKTLYLNL